MKRLILFVSFLLWALTACSGGGEPQRIASYPADPAQPVLISPPADVIYNAWLEMDVADVERAAARAEDLAYQYNGYLVSSQTWYQTVEGRERQYCSVVLAVSPANYDRLRSALLKLGTLRHETVNGQLEENGYGRQARSYITVNFSPAAWPSWPSWPVIGGWNPQRTIEQAFGVFLTLFGFLADIVLWTVIVIGPFALLGLGAWAAVRKLRSWNARQRRSEDAK